MVLHYALDPATKTMYSIQMVLYQNNHVSMLICHLEEVNWLIYVVKSLFTFMNLLMMHKLGLTKCVGQCVTVSGEVVFTSIGLSTVASHQGYQIFICFTATYYLPDHAVKV